ncbi:MAG: ABC transporter ATP-binding protein [Candidatus Sulfotelmatobacter sp.]
MIHSAEQSPWKIEAHAVSKAFRHGATQVEALRQVSFTIAPNEFAVFLGPSGCGKSTLLRIIAGFEQPSAGELLVNGSLIIGPGPDRGVVFQTYASFPWLTVERNIEFGLSVLRMPRSQRHDVVRHWIETTGLTGFEKAYPSALSGGMRQRLAIARTLATQPDVLLLDEPFAALDAQTRSDMQEMLLHIWATHRTTVVFVTHDLREAVYLADRVLVMSPRPSAIQKIIEISLPRPRRRDIIFSREFARVESELLKILRGHTPAAK